MEENLKCRFVVVKVASRCNLNCSYCYMYNKGDETYQLQPKVMSDAVVEALIERVYTHCAAHAPKTFNFVLHGGEPLLAKPEWYRNFVHQAQARFADLPTQLRFGIQTNGVLVDEAWCEVFAELGIRIGISLDGLKATNDRFRVYHNGKGAYDDIIRGYQIAHAHPTCDTPGILTVIDVEACPEATYTHLNALKPQAIDFLIPDGNHDRPGVAQEGTPVADWLIRIFDMWMQNGSEAPAIRIFDTIISSILGSEISSDSFGTGNTDVLVIETNGDIEPLDVLKICGNGFTKGSANVLHTSFDEALQTPLAKLYQLSHRVLSQKCQQCPIVEICGGGYLPHRYSSNNGFDNPSVYCHDLMKLITHIQNRVFEQLPPELKELGISAITYEEARAAIDQVIVADSTDSYAQALMAYENEY